MESSEQEQSFETKIKLIGGRYGRYNNNKKPISIPLKDAKEEASVSHKTAVDV